MQLGTDNRVAELSNQAKLHSFEAERAEMVKEETAKALSQCQVECEKLQKKVEVQNASHDLVTTTLNLDVFDYNSNRPTLSTLSVAFIQRVP